MRATSRLWRGVAAGRRAAAGAAFRSGMGGAEEDEAGSARSGNCTGSGGGSWRSTVRDVVCCEIAAHATAGPPHSCLDGLS